MTFVPARKLSNKNSEEILANNRHITNRERHAQDYINRKFVVPGPSLSACTNAVHCSTYGKWLLFSIECLPLILFVFWLRFTCVFVAQAVHRDPFTSLFICQRFSLLHFPMRTKALSDDVQSYSVLDFLSTKPPLNSKRRTRVGSLQCVHHLASFR